MPLLKPRYPHVNWNDPLSRGLVAAFNLGEGFGTTVRDITDSGSRGTLQAGVSWATKAAYGTTLSFAGTSTSWVNCGSAPKPQIAGPVSIAALVYPTISNAYQGLIVYGATSGARNYGMFLSAGGVTKLFVVLSGGATTMNADQILSTSWATNAWNLIVLTATGANVVIYLNGARVFSTASTAVAGASYTGATLNLGGDSAANAFYLNGNLAMAAVWNRALTDAENAYLYQDPFRNFRVPQRRRLLNASAPAPHSWFAPELIGPQAGF